MKTSLSLAIVFAAALLASPSFAQENAASSSSSPAAATASTGQPVTSGTPSEAEMMKQMMELANLNENHKLLGDLAGNWNYTVKMWMGDPNAKPEESKGSATRKPIMGGRYFVSDATSKMEMPGADGKKKEMTFKGMQIDGYDNVKKKFISTWIDNMGTGIMMSEGTYDPATKTFTYTGEYEAVPGMKQQVRELIKIVDKAHYTFEFYENRGGQEVKSMEINYTRKK